MNPNSALTGLIKRTQAQQQAQLLRRVRVVEQAQATRVVVDGRKLISFASNDYLGLSQHPDLIRALQNAANEWGVGSTAAHLLGGHRAPHWALEEKLSDWLGFEAALCFSSGWQANLSLLGTLLQQDDLCVQDRLNHASLLDAARLSGATLKRYQHLDIESATKQLHTTINDQDNCKALVSDGVFSMDGDLAPMHALSNLCKKNNAAFLLDDAHGIGVLGPHGQGSWAEQKLAAENIDGLMITFGKALGSFGAAVLGSRALIDGLMQFARPWIYTTATPPALASATMAAIRLVQNDANPRAHLKNLCARFQMQIRQIGLSSLDSSTPIQIILLNDATQAINWSNELEAQGFYAPAIRPPTVAQARLRITLSAAHTVEEIDLLCAALERLQLATK